MPSGYGSNGEAAVPTLVTLKIERTVYVIIPDNHPPIRANW